MNSLPLVSIIIPCYNGEAFIENTLKNVSEQSYSNWECIIVDDGSKDDSKSIIQDFIASDSRFLYHFQENKGLSGSRNTGIDLSKGDYIYFLDADDLIADFTIEELVRLLTPEIDIVFGKTAITDGQNKKIINYLEHNLPTKTKLENNSKQLIPLVLENKVSCVAHNRLYKKSFLITNDLRFKDGLLHEDEIWFFETLFYSNAIILNDSPSYFYNTGNQSSITNNFNIKNTQSYLRIVELLYSEYYQKSKSTVDKEVITTYITYLKMIIITHCYFLTSANEKSKVSTLIRNTFKTIETHRTHQVLSEDLEKLHQRFNKVYSLGLDTTLNYLRFYRSKSIKKILKRNLILLKATIKN